MSGITRKSDPQLILAALQNASNLKEVERIARQCTPAQLFEVVLPWCSTARVEVAEVLAGEKAVAQVEISGDDVDGGWWTFQIGDGKLSSQKGKQGRPDIGVHLDIFTWEDLQTGENDPPRAYTQGRIKFSGNPAIGVRVLGRLRKYL